MASISPPGPGVTTDSSLLPNASIFRRHWNPFHVERSLLVDAICTMRLATPQYGQSDGDQFNVLCSYRIVWDGSHTWTQACLGEVSAETVGDRGWVSMEAYICESGGNRRAFAWDRLDLFFGDVLYLSMSFSPWRRNLCWLAAVIESIGVRITYNLD